ncbi:MAG TPA: efflux RND transporter periplasmic adaptor subunit [Polyangia bacterium]|jgi:HlyD family secretion protein|nr:efflux RND transporter periplasmic adaptor subunit [Polyangia bacterium]
MADATTIENGAGGGKSRFVTIGGVAALAALVYGGYRLYMARQPYEWSGTVEARTITVGSRAGGRIAKILVREGDRVKGGQPLIELEPGDIMAQQLQAQGSLDQAQANLDKLVKGARPEEIEAASARAKTATAALAETKTGARREQILGAQARLKAQAVALEKAELDANRYRQLFARGAAARAELDNTETALQSAIATRDALKQSLEELTNGSRREDVDQAMARAAEARASERLIKAGSRVEDIKAARGEVEAAQGRLDAIKTLVDELVIKAPRDARVESLDLRPGDLLAPSAAAATLLEDDQLYVRIYVPETLIGHLHPGEKVPVTVDSFPDKSYQGVVEHINSVGEYSPRNLQTADERADQVFATRIGLRDGRDDLRAGMAAFIKVPK